MEKIRETQREILLVPLGKVLTDLLEEIAVALWKTYRLHVRIGRSEEPDTSFYSDARRQFDADRLLGLLAGRKRDSLAAVLGIVDADMFYGEKNFVFGACSAERGIAVEALARLREEYYGKSPKRELFLRRAVTEAIAQVGQALGLPPCQQKGCALQPVNSLWKLDEKGQALCDACLARLAEKLRAKRHEPAPAKHLRPAAEASAPQTGEPLVGESGMESLPAEEDTAVEAPAETQRPAAGEPGPDDESLILTEELEPEIPAAEETAMHVESEKPEEPLDADQA